MIPGLLLSAVVLASSPAGLGVPNHGGAFGGPTQPGVYGLTATPTAALSEAPELLVDLALIRSYFGVQLDGQEMVDRRGLSPLPYFAYTMPLGKRFGLGLQLGLPFARTGDSAEDGPFRMWSISGGILLLEPRLSVAWRATDKWSFGTGLRVAFSQFTNRVAMDTGAAMYQLLGEPAEELIGDPLLEGERIIADGRGRGLGFSLGARYAPVERVVFVASYHSSLSTPLTGVLEVIPSKDLNLLIRADLIGQWRYPQEFHAGLSVPVGPIDVHANAEYIGWGSTTSTLATLNDAYVVSDDPLLSSILNAYGLDDPAALGSIETSSESGMQNILTGGVHLSWQADAQWMFLLGASYTPGAIRDAWISPSNIDMDGMDYRVGTKWTPTEALEFGLSLDVWSMFPRNITNSNADPKNPTGLPNTPSANGKYELAMQRLGLSGRLRF
jgi:long-subunit fatty acid transport protein